MNKNDFKLKQSLCQKRINKLKKRPTISEIIFKNRLDSAGIKYMFQKGFIEGNNFCIADFYIPKPYKIVIEIDGEYHNNSNQIKRDLNKDRYYKERGFKIIRIKNNEVSTYNLSFLFNQQ
jgi:very-short-patch-repair endonuclease